MKRIAILIILIILILLGIGSLYYLEIIKTSSVSLSFFLYILSIPTAILIKKLKKKRKNFGIPLEYKKEKRMREDRIKKIEKEILKNKEEIKAIEAIELEFVLPADNLSELAQIGKKLLNI